MKLIYIVLLTLLLPISGCSDFYSNDLQKAIEENNLVEIDQLLGEHPKLLEAYLYDGWTPLTLAAREGKLKVTKLLVKHGVDLEHLEGSGNSALAWATFNQHIEVVRYLISMGANPCFKGEKGSFPYTIAKNKGYNELKKILPKCTK
ncbi:ankyrin repeat domain-containing protein [Zooshikella harenae]|uniref:Ankyrin repeat domain-containing protein n=1 Tax=Zooshikella harenae TaxID=2827238 RepID=A0ABS5ZJ76_9GAMM|nr:ankyrin repeat domain-containing protein [Zooshikella harenae]MBU2714127.1 ankyrin repeat domain-containing protein [Zooshikella harenae]